MNMKGAEKMGVKYLIGTEIETNIKNLDCESCDYCSICDDCPVCEDCVSYHWYCDDCTEEIRREIIEIAEENGWIEDKKAEKLRENLDSDEICSICQSFHIWSDIFCEDCNRCDGCEYVYNPDYCPLMDEYNVGDVDITKIEKYLDGYYNDGSCGMEYCTKPFNSLKTYWEAVKAIVSEIGKENIDISRCCGGHINISWTNGDKSWKNYEKTIAKNILYFADLLSYMFCSPETHYRDGYKDFPWDMDDINDDIYNKYTCVHIKDYAVEIRIPDSPKDVDNHILFTAVLLALSLKTVELPWTDEIFKKTKETYEKINKYGDQLKPADIKHLEEKYKILRRFIEKPLKQLGEENEIDLMKALDYRFKHPKYLEDQETEFNLNQFKMQSFREKTSRFIQSFAKQLPLTAFA